MKCRLCDAQTTEFFLGTVRYADCPDCGFLGLDRSLFLAREAERARYTLHDNNPEEPGYRLYLESFVETAVRPFVPVDASILDFGSGPVPALSIILATKGYRVGSYDPFFAPGSRWEDRMWDAIILHEVAEHLHEPTRTFARVAACTAPGGIVAVRSRFRPDSLAEFETWWYRKDSTHVGFFARRTFETLAEMMGFRVIFSRNPDTTVMKKQSSDPGPHFQVARSCAVHGARL